MRTRNALLTSFGLGAGLMYFLDPDRGRRRRALARDQIVHSAHVTADATSGRARDLANRATGVAARLRRVLRRRGQNGQQMPAGY